MKSALALLLAGSALVAAFGVPSVAAMRGTSSVLAPGFASSGSADHDIRLIKVSDDHDDDNDDDDQRAGHERDDHDDDDDEDRDTRARISPAPAGTVASPANGLFGNGAPPLAVTN